MMRFLFWSFALSALCAAALFYPIAGKSLWARSRAHGIPQATERTAGKLAAWVKGVTAHREEKAAARKPVAARAKSASARPAAEKLTQDDRVALDALVAGVR